MAYSLGLLYRVTGDDRYAARLRDELLHVSSSNCSQWDPFGLVLSEMTHAVAIGYDWLYDTLSSNDKEQIVAAVIQRGFKEALKDYNQGAFWHKCVFNWNIVTNGGLLIGALAFFEDSPDLAAQVYGNATEGLPYAFDSFAPKGGWHEGPMYWEYVAKYALAFTQSMDTATTSSSPNPFLSYPGFNETGLYRIYITGPSGRPFSYADSRSSSASIAAPSSYFFGYANVPTTSTDVQGIFAYEGRRLFNVSQTLDFGLNQCLFGYCDCAKMLLEYSTAGSVHELEDQPTARLFPLSAYGWDGRAAIGVFRSSWGQTLNSSPQQDSQAWLAFKAHNGLPNHNDLDGGTWVFEMGGQRWAEDLGADSYQLPGYWTQTTKGRYRWYRKSTVGHNTLSFNNDHDKFPGNCAQNPFKEGITEISVFNSTEDRHAKSPAFAIVELTAAYTSPTTTASNDTSAPATLTPPKRVQRGFAFTSDYRSLVIVDEFDHQSADNVTWAMHTLADISLNQNKATLQVNGTSLFMSIAEPLDAVFQSKEVRLQPPQEPSPGLNKLYIVANPSSCKRLVIHMSILDSEAIPQAAKLSDWESSGPFQGSA